MPRPQIGQSISQQGFFSSRDSLSVPCVSQPLHSYSATTSDMDLSRKNESKSSSKLKPGEQPLLGSWNPSTIAPRESIAHPTATSASTNHLTSNNGNGVNNNNADRWVEEVESEYQVHVSSNVAQWGKLTRGIWRADSNLTQFFSDLYFPR